MVSIKNVSDISCVFLEFSENAHVLDGMRNPVLLLATSIKYFQEIVK